MLLCVSTTNPSLPPSLPPSLLSQVYENAAGFLRIRVPHLLGEEGRLLEEEDAMDVYEEEEGGRRGGRKKKGRRGGRGERKVRMKKWRQGGREACGVIFGFCFPS